MIISFELLSKIENVNTSGLSPFNGAAESSAQRYVGKQTMFSVIATTTMYHLNSKLLNLWHYLKARGSHSFPKVKCI